MTSQLQKQFAFLEEERSRLLQHLKSLNSEQLNFHEPAKWSLNQVYAHLIASEQLSVNYLKKKTQGLAQLPNTGFVEELKMTVLIISQRLPVKFKAPKVVVENTPIYESAKQIEEAWNNTRSDLAQVLNRFAEDQLNRKVYRHPLAGLLNIKQALRFFQEHMIHHQPQIKNLLRQIQKL